MNPNWDNNNAGTIKSELVKSDSVYFYKKRGKNKDSVLAMAQYFDTSGNLLERTGYNLKGEVIEISNFTYINDALFKKESVSTSPININGSNVAKKIITYDHDSLGNVITEKEFSYYGNALKPLSVTVLDKEYDSLGNTRREFLTLPGFRKFLHRVYNYLNGMLIETQTYDTNKEWMYSYLYEYDEAISVKREYLYNSSKTLTVESFYDEKKRLVKEKSYTHSGSVPGHTTQAYVYNSNGLLESQSVEDVRGGHYYYRHFYKR